MRLVVSKNPLLIMVMIAAMLFPMLVVEGAMARDSQARHQHSSHEIQHAHSENSHGAAVNDSAASVSAVMTADSIAGTSEDCHHPAPQNNCTVHCSSSSCVTIVMDFGSDLAFLPKTPLHTVDTLQIPAPRPPSIHRPPLATV